MGKNTEPATSSMNGVVCAYMSCYECPVKNKALHNYGEGRNIHYNVASWEACAALCKKQASCIAWAWGTDDSEYKHLCISAKTYDGHVVANHIYVGTRSCQGEESNSDEEGN